MNHIALLVITLAASTAHADEVDDLEGRDQIRAPDTYVAAGAITGHDKFDFGGFGLELGRRLDSRLPLFGRVMGEAGTSSLSTEPGRGTFVEGRVGIEARQCTHHGMLCGSIGLDVGVHRGRFTHVDLGMSKRTVDEPSLDEHFDSLIAVPRLTVDGSGRVRVRGTFELPNHLRDQDGVSGYAISLALGVGF